MEKLLDMLIEEARNKLIDINPENFLLKIKYDTSFFVKVSSAKSKWFIREIEMDEKDQEELIDLLKLLCDKYVEEYRLEDRDPEFIYKYKMEGMLKTSLRIQKSFAEAQYDINGLSSEDGDESITHEIRIENYENNEYPLSDEVNLIVHRLLVDDFIILLFCNQSRTSLANVNLKTLIDNKLRTIEKKNIYRIRNDISFVMTSNHYYIVSVDYFESLFSFDSQIKRRKDEALQALTQSNLIEGLDELKLELNKGYMARSVSMISMNADEMREYVEKHKNAISALCKDYETGVKFNTRTNKFTIIDMKVASLFITYLFSNRMGTNIEGELIYFKTFRKLKRVASVTA